MSLDGLSGQPLQTDILIIGQGLAGTLLAYALERRNLDFLLLDNGWRNASSMAAAGLINPVTGQRLVKTRQLEQYLPIAIQTYRNLEQQLGIPLYHKRPMLRLLRNDQEGLQLQKRRLQADYQPLLGPLLAQHEIDPRIRAPRGALKQHHAAYVELPSLLQVMRDRYRAMGRLIEGEADLLDLRPKPSQVELGPIRAQRVVFCEGYRGKDNPWFGQLPFQPDKGEILTLELEGPALQPILNAGEWLIPLGASRYRTGSTHDHNQLDEAPTPEGQQYLLKGLSGLLHQVPRWHILQHRAGVRPATLGTNPLLGPHPQQPRLHIFNGFGAKGSLLIPWHAERYADFLQGDAQAVPSHAHIGRFRR